MPFSITPDPAYLYLSARHQEALGHLLYGTGQYGGFVQLTGEVGTGKTTMVRALLSEQLPDVDVAMIHNPRQSEREFVQSLCDELGIDYGAGSPTLKHLVDALNEHLLATHALGRRTVLIIDEAQNLDPDVLEQVRLLTNLETAKEKLLRIMLVGQPELAALLARPDLRQLASRITARYHLTPLDAAETREYIEHRMRVAGAVGEIFSAPACDAVFRHSQGNPRLINVLCDRALLATFVREQYRVSRADVDIAAHELTGAPGAPPTRLQRWLHALTPARPLEWGLAGALLLSIAALLFSLLAPRDDSQEDAQPAQPLAAEPATSMPAAVTSPTLATDLHQRTTPSDTPATAATATAAATNAESASPAETRLPASLAEVAPTAAERLQLLALPLDRALAALAAAWKLTPTADETDWCTARAAEGLECYRSHGTLDDLRQMDRPAVLGLTLDDGMPHYFLLQRLDAETARLGSGTGFIDLPADDFTPLWNGDFLLLWRRHSHALRLDATTHGADLDWLWTRLTELGVTTGKTPDSYAARVRGAVQTFQRARGLSADGIAGVRTLIELGDGEADTPTLSAQTPRSAAHAAETGP